MCNTHTHVECLPVCGTQWVMYPLSHYEGNPRFNQHDICDIDTAINASSRLAWLLPLPWITPHLICLSNSKTESRSRGHCTCSTNTESTWLLRKQKLIRNSLRVICLRFATCWVPHLGRGNVAKSKVKEYRKWEKQKRRKYFPNAVYDTVDNWNKVKSCLWNSIGNFPSTATTAINQNSPAHFLPFPFPLSLSLSMSICFALQLFSEFREQKSKMWKFICTDTKFN